MVWNHRNPTLLYVDEYGVYIIWWLYYPIEAHTLKNCFVWRKQVWKNGLQKDENAWVHNY